VLAIGSAICAVGALFAPLAREAGEFVPDATAAGAPPLDGKVFTVDTPRYRARLALLDDGTRQGFLAKRTGSGIDPFVASPRPGSPAFLTFLLNLENLGPGDLYFQPLLCPISTPQGEMRNPLDLPSIQTTYEMLDHEMPPAYAGIKKALFGDQVVLRPTAPRIGGPGNLGNRSGGRGSGRRASVISAKGVSPRKSLPWTISSP